MGVHVFPILNPPPSPSHPSGSSQCTSPERPVSCIEPGLAICLTYGNIHVAVLFQKLSIADCPLYLRLLAGPDTDVLSFVLKENETGEVEVGLGTSACCADPAHGACLAGWAWSSPPSAAGGRPTAAELGRVWPKVSACQDCL